jgi:segregation and condensation protein A
MSIILRQLKVNNMLEFSHLFDVAKDGIPKLVVCFLAILELTREGLLRLTQQAPFSPIYVQLNSRD